jgi:hypothetical protein
MGIRPAVPPTAASENPTKLTHGLRADVRPRGRGWAANGNTNRPAEPSPVLNLPPQLLFEFIGETRGIPRLWGWLDSGTRLAVVYRSVPVVGCCGCPVWPCKGVWGSLGVWGGTGGEQ